jgi:hypothetical protein
VTINRPEARNAVSPEVHRGMIAAWADFAENAPGSTSRSSVRSTAGDLELSPHVLCEPRGELPDSIVGIAGRRAVRARELTLPALRWRVVNQEVTKAP